MVRIRWPDPDVGDQIQEMMPAEAVDFILDQKEKLPCKFGVWEGQDAQLELEMATRSGILEALKERSEQTLRLVPIIAGG
ncbi:MAG: hypothetical protein KAX31_03500 [Thermoplasmata archaeon]|nr:hypothetical protein [Thermoplasmata archaeon]